MREPIFEESIHLFLGRDAIYTRGQFHQHIYVQLLSAQATYLNFIARLSFGTSYLLFYILRAHFYCADNKIAKI